MMKQADERYANCEELRQDLLQSLREEPSRARQSQVPTITRAKSDPKVAPAKAGSARALVADDDPATRYLLGSVLQRHQIAYDEAANGADAVKLLKSNTYSLVFLDLLMPRIDGWGVLDFLRSHRRNEMPRTFIVTGVKNQKLSAADQDIVTGLLFKPIDIEQVEKLVS
jgi:CheY-like chemotaxis protein